MAKTRDRGSVVERGNGWRVRISAGIDPVTGKRLWLCGTCGSCGSKQEAERLRTKFLGQVDDKKASRTRASLGALLDEWLPGAELGLNTRDNYAGLIERFIRPANTVSRSTGTGRRPAGVHPGWAVKTEIGEGAQADTALAPVIVLAEGPS